MTVKTFTDLTGLKEKNVAELETIGIKTVEELAAAVNDDVKVKEVIKTCSGIGPKTVEKWKGQLEGTEVAEKAAAKVEVVEDGEKAYVVNIKPELSEETADLLAKRAIINGHRPAFKRQEWYRRATLGDAWRRPKGIHSKMRMHWKRRPPMVDIGYAGPAAVRGYHPSGFEEVMVYNVDGLEGVDPKTQAVRIGGTVGTKKRLDIQARADELKIRVLNRLV